MKREKEWRPVCHTLSGPASVASCGAVGLVCALRSDNLAASPHGSSNSFNLWEPQFLDGDIGVIVASLYSSREE